MPSVVTEAENRSSAVNVEDFIDPRRPLSWSTQMIALLRSGHYREGYEILAEKMPFVDNMLRPFAERLAGRQNYWTGTYHWIKRFIDDSRPLRVLDVGCGIGSGAMEFALEGHQAWGIDVLDCMIDRGREVAESLGLSDRVHLVAGDIRRLEQHFEAGFFDAVVACDIFEHLDDESIGQVLSGLEQVVRPGGTIVIQTSPCRYYYWFDPARKKMMWLLAPLAWLPDRLFTAYVRWLDRWPFRDLRDEHTRFHRHEPGHINCMDHVHLRRLLMKAGLEQIRTLAVNAHPGFKDEGCLKAGWTKRLFSRKSVACRNVFGIAKVRQDGGSRLQAAPTKPQCVPHREGAARNAGRQVRGVDESDAERCS
jgi:ubiquinone/menaquinone biosynthesis C-methylase UbiE